MVTDSGLKYHPFPITNSAQSQSLSLSFYSIYLSNHPCLKKIPTYFITRETMASPASAAEGKAAMPTAPERKLRDKILKNSKKFSMIKYRVSFFPHFFSHHMGEPCATLCYNYRLTIPQGVSFTRILLENFYFSRALSSLGRRPRSATNSWQCAEESVGRE